MKEENIKMLQIKEGLKIQEIKKWNKQRIQAKQGSILE